MKIGENIKALRNQFSYSQESLAEKVYVSRQTISNWENGKSYPDLNSLILLAQTFQTTIDELVKGDLKMMKETIKKIDIEQFNHLSLLYTGLFLATIVTPIPLFHFLGKLGLVIWIVVAAVAMFMAILVEREKKKFNIQTYKEIIAFAEGKKLDVIAQAREEGKRPYQKLTLALLSALITLVIALFFMKILG